MFNLMLVIIVFINFSWLVGVYECLIMIIFFMFDFLDKVCVMLNRVVSVLLYVKFGVVFVIIV